MDDDEEMPLVKKKPVRSVKSAFVDYVSSLNNIGLEHISEHILSFLDADSLQTAELVSDAWKQTVAYGKSWKKLLEAEIRKNFLCRRLMERCGWMKYVFKSKTGDPRPAPEVYQRMYLFLRQELNDFDKKWEKRNFSNQVIDDGEVSANCVQHDNEKIVCGMNDGSIKIYDRSTLQCTKILNGHASVVRCLQYDGEVLISGSEDATVRIWNLNTGACLKILEFSAKIQVLRFISGTLVTGLCNQIISVWNMDSPLNIHLRCNLAQVSVVYCVDLDPKFIVTGAHDYTVKVWDTPTGNLLRTLRGHTSFVQSVQYCNGIVLSVSLNSKLRLWNIETGDCVKVLRTNVCDAMLDEKQIVSVTIRGDIAVCKLSSVLGPDAIFSSYHIRTKSTWVVVKCWHFNDLSFVMCLGNGNITICDFLKPSPEFSNIIDTS